jgi:phage tail sheath protein FI
MPSFVSPGVYSREIDLSLYAPALSTTIFGVVGGARKGPLNEPYYIGSIPEYVDVFGLPTTPMGYAAYQYLRYGRQLQVVRVADDDAAESIGYIKDSVPVNTIKVSAVSKGTWADGIVVLTTSGTSSGVKLTVKEGDYAVETWDNVTRANCATACAGSKYITLETVPAGVEPTSGQTITLSGGDDGLTALNDADYVGTITDDTYTGLQCFSNAEIIDLNIVAVPGVSSAAVVNALLELCRVRQDCMALVDPPYGLTSQNVVKWHNGVAPYDDHQAYNSNYGALQWPWHEIYDPYTAAKVWVAPSGPTAAIYAYSDYTTEVWFAPAGLTRGRVLNSLTLETSPSLGQRDLLQGNQNAVNPFVNFSKDGITLWGQRTLQRAPTALDRVNVRRLLLYTEKVLATAAKYLVFEPNDPVTWRRFVGLATEVLAPVKNRRGLYDFRIICDESTNPPDVIDQNKMVGKCLLKPVKAAEVIQLDWTILSTGAEFTEYV